MTPEAFLAWEGAQHERHEFVRGEVYAMTGGTAAHAEIAGNLYTALRSRLMPRGCRVYQGDIKVGIEGNFFYPDVVVQCGPRELKSQVAAQPVVLAEVLSPSTEKYDQVTKWPLYQRLASLQAFLMIDQEQVLVHLYRRDGAAWIYTLHRRLDEVLELAEPALRVPVRELYVGIDGLDAV